MGDTIIQLAGTPAGEALALALILLSALSHAIFGAINKSGVDPYLNRGAINVCYAIMLAPFALFTLPWPTADVWAVLWVTFFAHILYEWLQSRSFAMGAFTLVYPIARGTGPFIVTLAALIVFQETLGVGQLIGMGVLTFSIFGLAWANRRSTRAQGIDPKSLRPAIAAALGTGVMIAVYTIIDAYGIRLAENPFTFLAWFFFMGGFGFPIIALVRWHRMASTDRPAVIDLAYRGLFGSVVAITGFGGLMLATRLDKVGEAAALRETSIIFATAIGVLFFREKIDAIRVFLIFGIAMGAILIEFA